MNRFVPNHDITATDSVSLRKSDEETTDFYEGVGRVISVLKSFLRRRLRISEAVGLISSMKLRVPTIADASCYHSFLIEIADLHGLFGAGGYRRWP